MRLTGFIASPASDNVVKAFNAQFPDVKIEQKTGFSKYLDAQIDRDWQAGKPSVDIAVLQTVQDYPRWNAAGRLLKYKPATFDDISNELKDLDGAYFPVNICKSTSHILQR
jgi:ABC-type Fe3+ transport system substrate-binding protein